MGQFASTLMAMTAPISCVSKLLFDRDTALIGEFMGNQNSNPLGFMAIVKRTLPPPDIVILNAGAHVYSTMNQSTPKSKPKVNATSNMAAMRRILDHVIAEIRQERETATDGDVAQSRRYVWASMIPGHAGCRRNGADRNGPATSSQKPRSAPFYNWEHFQGQDTVAEAKAAASGGLLHFMDRSMLYWRSDAHASDCLHFCTPGPINEVMRVLLGALQTGELDPREMS